MIAAHAVTATALICIAADLRKRDTDAANIVSRIGFYIYAAIIGGALGYLARAITS